MLVFQCNIVLHFLCPCPECSTASHPIVIIVVSRYFYSLLFAFYFFLNVYSSILSEQYEHNISIYYSVYTSVLLNAYSHTCSCHNVVKPGVFRRSKLCTCFLVVSTRAHNNIRMSYLRHTIHTPYITQSIDTNRN